VLNNTANVTSPTDPNVTNASAVTNVNTLANLTITKTAVATVTAVIVGLYCGCYE